MIRSIVIFVTVVLMPAAASASETSASGELAPPGCDPAKVLGVDSCVKCHAAEVQQWKATPHAQTFDTLHRSPEAKAIAERLGLRSVKRNETCTQCHYTMAEQRGKHRAVAGVSCESCHGAARDWVALHSDYGGPDVTRLTETAAHRQQRIDESIAAGMNNPANLYLIARQCLACHTTPNEELVNVGGHVPGSIDFELVAWSQGMVRHNFLQGDGVNVPATAERRRVMYVVGVLADLEASFRAVAKATEKATYGVTAARRALAQKKRLYEIAQIVDNSHIQQALEAALSTPLKLGNRTALLQAAGTIGESAYQFAATADGVDLEAIDPLLPKLADYK